MAFAPKKNESLEAILKKIENAARTHRNSAAESILKKPELFSELLRLTFQVDKKIAIRAAWVLEWICSRNLNLLAVYLDEFISNIHLVKKDSAVRPIAKICELIAKAYRSKKINAMQQTLTKKHIDTIVEVGFDWLLTPQKVAVRAYTMETLYLLGFDYDWVHPELKVIISNKIIHESPGCKARGKKILALLNKTQ